MCKETQPHSGPESIGSMPLPLFCAKPVGRLPKETKKIVPVCAVQRDVKLDEECDLEIADMFVTIPGQRKGVEVTGIKDSCAVAYPQVDQQNDFDLLEINFTAWTEPGKVDTYSDFAPVAQEICGSRTTGMTTSLRGRGLPLGLVRPPPGLIRPPPGLENSYDPVLMSKVWQAAAPCTRFGGGRHWVELSASD